MDECGMNRAIEKLLILFCLAFCGLSGVKAAAEESHDQGPAITAATEWLAIVDAGDYARSWQTASPFLKNAVGQQKFASGVQSVRRPLGKVLNRRLESSKHFSEVPGAPDGEYIVLIFKTSFENKENVLETVVPMREKDGTWKVSGYYIR